LLWPFPDSVLPVAGYYVVARVFPYMLTHVCPYFFPHAAQLIPSYSPHIPPVLRLLFSLLPRTGALGKLGA